ncbi:meiotic recombination protein SPO11 [Microplitis mediator]|uniref:meiotic recombination protein SPO11 n=1 Tax=Microplitis mediator TaxID=375433 RepID=UPI002555403A|nr:meiotic recombination protein SPO11 [Microplitis mediator]
METKRIQIPVIDNTEKKQQLINKIEATTLTILKQICNSQIPKISYKRRNPEINLSKSTSIAFNDCDDFLLSLVSCDESPNRTFSDNIIEIDSFDEDTNSTQDSASQQPESIVDFFTISGRKQLTRLMIILSKAHKLLLSNKIQTKRSLYYELKSEESTLFESERVVDYQINSVAKLLECSTWDLGFIATSKGLVAGNLKLFFENNDTIFCDVLEGCLVPQLMSSNMGQLTAIETTAKSIIVVEKEAIFNKLMSEKCPEKLDSILITGKGYPDTATRIFVKILVDKLELPVFVLVDCNPHGFEIMCTYKYGSLNLWWERKELKCLNIKWIGIYPTEIPTFFLKKLPLTDSDLKKLDALEKRTYLTDNERNELTLMKQGKVEMEAIATNNVISMDYLTSVYIPMKIRRLTHTN